MKNCLVSVVLPVHNTAAFIGEAIASVLKQTERDFELLVVDDRSTDGSATIARQAGGPSTRVLSNEGHGVAAARNTAIRAARGKFLAFLDADDIWMPEFLRRSLEIFYRNPGVDFAFSAVRWIDEDGNPIGRPVMHHSGAFSYEDLFLEYLPVTASSWMVRASAIEQCGLFDTNLVAGSDHEFCLRLALARPQNVEGVGMPLVQYRRRAGQITADRNRKLIAWDQISEKHTALTFRATPPLLRKATARLRRALAALAFEEGAYEEARGHFAEAVRLGGFPLFRDRRTWLMGAAMTASLLPAAVRQPLVGFGRRRFGAA